LSYATIELRHLIALKAVAEEGSLRQAAARLGYTQPAVSHQIACLERAVGVLLIERSPGPRPAVLTPTARVFLHHAEAVLARMHFAIDEATARADGRQGELVVGTYPSVGARLLPVALRDFRSEWPDVDVRLVESPSDNLLLDELECGEIDYAFVILPVRAGPFAVRRLLSDPYVLLIPDGWRIGRDDKAVPLDRLADLPLVEFGHSEDRVGHYLRSKGCEPQVVFRTDDNATLAAVVASGIGVAAVPELTVVACDGVRIARTRPALEPRQVGLAWHVDRELGPAFTAFAEVVAAAADNPPPA
jgi:DNA-binding transcriptional LysR family regulator